MDLKEKYSHFFDDAELSGGESLFKAEKVSIYESSQLHVYAEVDAVQYSEVKLNIRGNTLSFECECHSSTDKKACEHIWAVICACSAFGDLEKATKRSVKKMPVVSGSSSLSGSSHLRPLSSGGHAGVSCLSGLASSSPLHSPSSGGDAGLSGVSKSNSDELTSKLDIPCSKLDIQKEVPCSILNISREFDHYKETAVIDELAPQFEINYVVNIGESSQGSNVIIQTYWRQQKKDKTWSGRAELIYAPEDSYSSKSDHAIMKMIGRYYQKPTANAVPSNKPVVNMFKVPEATAGVLLLKMAEFGQLYWRSSQYDSELNKLTLSLNSYKFNIELYEEARHSFTAQGFLVSSSTIIDIAECIHLSKSNFFITSNQIGSCDYVDAFKYAQKLCYERSLHFKSWKAEDFVQELISGTSLPISHFPAPLNYELSEPLIVPCLYFQTAKFKYKNSEQLHVELSFDYNGTQILDKSQQERVINASGRSYFVRDKNREQVAIEQLNAMSFRYNTNPNLEELGWKLHPAKLDATVQALLKDDWHIIAHGKSYRKPQDKQVSLSSDLDWFELKATVTYGDEEVSLPELMAARKRGEDHVLLGDGSFGVLPIDWLKDFTVLTEIGLTEDDLIKFKRSQSALLDALLIKQNVSYTDDHLQLINKKIDQVQHLAPEEAPASFVGRLRPYQKEGLGWMIYLQDLGMCGCLADDMGLGKTVQVLSLLEHRRIASTGKPSLIVLPKSLIFNWQQETKKFTPQMRVLIHTGAQRDKHGKSFAQTDLVLTTYGTLKRDIISLQSTEFDYCILDESQAIKNSVTDAAKAVRLVKSEHRLTMTGTPIENHAGELLSQLDFLNPGMFGRSKLLTSFSAGGSKLSVDDFTAINKAVRPFILRRTKEEVAKDLPEKVEQVLYCDLEPWQREKYDELKAHYRKELLTEGDDGEDKNQIEILEALLRLRQACCHPALINEKFMHAPSAKLELIVTKVRELIEEKHKVLMFSQFTSFLGLIRTRLEQDNIKFSYLDGQTKDRDVQVKNFQEDPEVEAFLISLKAGGTGLNLTAADYVFLLDPWWNPAIEAQAIDRAYRIGQKRNVFAYKLIAKDTVEEKVLQMQRDKKEVADQIINGNANKITSISRSDLEFLLQ